MPSAYTNLLFHIVYSTKYRKPLITPDWQDDLYGYIGGIIREEKGKDEYLALLRKHNIEFDERYVFEEEHIG